MSGVRSLVLAIDTSGPHAFAALADDRLELLSEKSSRFALSHSEELSTLIAECLKETGEKLTSVRAVLIGEGPGSFTGLRIGFSYALGLSSALGLKIIPIPSSLGAAMEFLSSDTLVAVVADARRDELFVSTFIEAKEGTIESRVSGEIWKVDALISTLQQVKEASGASELKIVSQDVVHELEIASPRHIASGLIGAFGRNREFREYAGHEELSTIMPNYVRLPAAKTVKERQRA